MTITKKDITNTISVNTTLSKGDSKLVLDGFLNLIKKNYTDVSAIKIPSFGVFILKKSKKRVGRNPKTKKEYIINSIDKLSFAASSIIKKSLN
jgi:integration host factor subunit alpha